MGATYNSTADNLILFANMGSWPSAGGPSVYHEPYYPIPMRWHLTCNCCLLYHCEFEDNKHLAEWDTSGGSWNFNHTPNSWQPWVIEHCLAGSGEITLLQEATTSDFIVSTVVNLASDGDEYRIKIGTGTTVTITRDGYFKAWQPYIGIYGRVTLNTNSPVATHTTDGFHFDGVYDMTDQPGVFNWAPEGMQVNVGAWREDGSTERTIYVSISTNLGGTAFRFDTPVSDTGNQITLGASGTGQFRNFNLYVADEFLCQPLHFDPPCLHGQQGFSVFAEITGLTNGTCDKCDCQTKDHDGNTRTFKLGYYQHDSLGQTYCGWRTSLPPFDFCYGWPLGNAGFSIEYDEDNDRYMALFGLGDMAWSADLGSTQPDCTKLNISSFTNEEVGKLCNGSSASVHVWSEPTTKAAGPDPIYPICDCQNGSAPSSLTVTVSGVVAPGSGNGTYTADQLTQWSGTVQWSGTDVVVQIGWGGSMWVSVKGVSFYSVSGVAPTPTNCSNINVTIPKNLNPIPYIVTGWENSWVEVTS